MATRPNAIKPTAAYVLIALMALGCSRARTAPSASAASSTLAASATPDASPPLCLIPDITEKYTVVFHAAPARVQEIFVGWRQPVASHTKMVRHPFTGQSITIQTTEPPDGDGDADSTEQPFETSIAEITGDYEQYLESRIPPAVRVLSHHVMKRIRLELITVNHAVTGGDDIPAALYPPRGCGAALPLRRLPDAMVSMLRAASTNDAKSNLVARLAKERDFSDWKEAEIGELVAMLQTFMQSAPEGDAFYLLPV